MSSRASCHHSTRSILPSAGILADQKELKSVSADGCSAAQVGHELVAPSPAVTIQSSTTGLQQAQCKHRPQHPAGFQTGSTDTAALSTSPARLLWGHSRDVTSHTTAIPGLTAGSGPLAPSLHSLQILEVFLFCLTAKSSSNTTAQITAKHFYGPGFPHIPCALDTQPLIPS